jgi:hypothetical protein
VDTLEDERQRIVFQWRCHAGSVSTRLSVKDRMWEAIPVCAVKGSAAIRALSSRKRAMSMMAPGDLPCRPLRTTAEKRRLWAQYRNRLETSAVARRASLRSGSSGMWAM